MPHPDDSNETNGLELLRDRIAAEVVRPIEERIESAPVSIAKMLTYFLEHLYDPRHLAVVRRGLRASKRDHEQFEQLMGEDFDSLREKTRIEITRRVLAESDASLVEIARALGFRFPGGLSGQFRKYYDMTPSAYRKAGAPELEPGPTGPGIAEREPPGSDPRYSEVKSAWRKLLDLPPQEARDLIFTLLDRYLPGEGEP